MGSRKSFKERVDQMLQRNCDSLVPDDWCVQTGACECQLLLDMLAALTPPPKPKKVKP